MMLSHLLSILVLYTVGCQTTVALLTEPPLGSRCNPSLSTCNSRGCSANTDCQCYSINTPNGTTTGDGMCASMMISCSVLTPCESDRVTCKQPETVCVQSHRCSNRPVCYPIALANMAVCPPLSNPNVTVVVEPESNVVICENATWENGTLVAGTYHSFGFELNQLNCPGDAVIDEHRFVYVADTRNHRIVKWFPEANSSQLVAGGKGPGSAREQLNYPTSLILTKTQDLIICDYNNRRIQLWPQNANYGETLINNVPCNQLFTDQHGELLFSTVNNEIFKWLPAENRTVLIMKAGGQNPPAPQSQMFFSQNGNVYVADRKNNRILKYRQGQVDAEIIAGGQAWQSSDLSHLTGPMSVIVDDKGTVYVAEQGNNRIVRWFAEGSKGILLVEQYFGLSDGFIRFDRAGNLYVGTYNTIIRHNINTNGCVGDTSTGSTLNIESSIG